MAGRSEVEIAGLTFFVKRLAPLDALRLAGDLQKKIIGPASGLIASMRSEGLAADDASLAKGIEALSNAMDGETLVWAYKKLVLPDYVSMQLLNGEHEKVTDALVALHDIQLDVLVKLAWEVAKINFLDFGKSVGGLIGMVR